MLRTSMIRSGPGMPSESNQNTPTVLWHRVSATPSLSQSSQKLSFHHVAVTCEMERE